MLGEYIGIFANKVTRPKKVTVLSLFWRFKSKKLLAKLIYGRKIFEVKNNSPIMNGTKLINSNLTLTFLESYYLLVYAFLNNHIVK